MEIADDLRAKIERGDYRPGDQIPTKAELMAEWGVALNTVARAVSELQLAGWVETQQGRGSFVRVPDAPDPTTAEEVVALRERVARLEDLVVSLHQHLGLEIPTALLAP